jgi:predicted HTH domain antitoxin
MPHSQIEVSFSIPIAEVLAEHRAEAERKAREAFVLTLLQQGDISAGRTAELLGVNRWQLSDLMSTYGISPFDDTVTQEELATEIDNLILGIPPE